MFKKIILLINLLLVFVSTFTYTQEKKILFFEGFEDTEFQSRGWYDHLKGALSTKEHVPGSKSSLECKFLQGERGPVGGTPGRHLFEETDGVYLSYYVKYSANYIGSGKPYHPHEFHFITNKNNIYVGPAFTNLTTYIEQNGGVPLLGIQDCENIDQSQIGVDLTDISEERGVAGCNGSSDGYPDDCYKHGELHRNGKHWRAGKVYFSDEDGKYYKNDWHFIEAYFKLNSIKNGKGVNDGIIRYWFDGDLIINHNDVLLRTSKHSDMMFNQFLIAPYIGDGSPVEQTMWIDNLTVATSRIGTGIPVDKHGHLSITPNPAINYIELSGVNFFELNKGKNITIYNALGISQMEITAPNHTSILRIDISSLPAGMYIIRIGELYGKFIKP
jgi:hypothetical protein